MNIALITKYTCVLYNNVINYCFEDFKYQHKALAV